MLSGPSGAGKTLTGLWLAEDLAGPDGRIVVVDTQRSQALDYAEAVTFSHVDWAPPFDPRQLGRELADMQKGDADVVIVDSISHFWAKPGGTLAIADGRYTGWKEARPAQEELLEGLMACPAHLILCARAKMRHEQVKNGQGQWEVHKLGEAPIQDDQFEYELDAGVTIDMGHRLAVSKSRSDDLPVGAEFPPGRENVRALARTWLDWLGGGEPLIAPEGARILAEAINDAGADARRAFLAEFGVKPAQLLASQAAAAKALVDRFTGPAAGARLALAGSEPQAEDGAA